MVQNINLTANPKVSALLVTYNHEIYIRQAIESLVAQQANFEFEILIADDCSEDQTTDIAREYEAAYPNVRLLPTESHLGITRNYQRGFAACRGEYIAVLEGDDYLIDSSKLRLVAKYLDENPTCAFCFHRVFRHDETCDDTVVYPSLAVGNHEKHFTARELARGNFIPGFSTCTYRRDIIAKLDPAIWKLRVREWPFNIVVAQNGSIGYLPIIMSVYRAHPGGIWSLKSAEERFNLLRELLEPYNQLLNFKYDAEFQTLIETFACNVRDSAAAPANGKSASLKPVAGQQLKQWIKPFVPPILITIARKLGA